MKQNVWHCCQDVYDRIDEAPGPHGYVFAHATPRPGQRLCKHYQAFTNTYSDSPFLTCFFCFSLLIESQFFHNTNYLLQYHNSGTNKTRVPGYNYFRKIEKFMCEHYEEGDDREHVKFSCSATTGKACSFCNEWSGPPIEKCPKPYPDYSCTKLIQNLFRSSPKGFSGLIT